MKKTINFNISRELEFPDDIVIPDDIMDQLNLKNQELTQELVILAEKLIYDHNPSSKDDDYNRAMAVI